MARNSIKRLLIIGGVSGGVLASAIGLFSHFFVINTSASFPLGLYVKKHRLPVKDDLMLVCPPDKPIFREALRRRFLSPGFCPAGTVAIIKRLVAVTGDVIRIAEEGVYVNGERLENSQRQDFRLADMEPLPIERILTNEEILLMSPHPMSFDARYFGVLHASVIVTPLEPFNNLPEQ